MTENNEKEDVGLQDQTSPFIDMAPTTNAGAAETTAATVRSSISKKYAAVLQQEDEKGPLLVGQSALSNAASIEEGRLTSRHAREVDLELARLKTPRVRRAWQNLYLRMMVVGESGTGKSTSVSNLFQAYSKSESEEAKAGGGTTTTTPRRVPPSGRSTPAELFRRSPEKLCEYFCVENREESIRMHYSIQDTPGYGDSFSPQQRLLDIVEFIRQQQRTYMERLWNLSTSSMIDPRVDVCLYFVPPHRLKEIDLVFMLQLSRVVPLIPLIAKADSMTNGELTVFRRELLTRASKRGIEFFSFSEHSFDEAKIFNVDRSQFPPFAVVSSDLSVKPDAFWPIREYRYLFKFLCHAPLIYIFLLNQHDVFFWQMGLLRSIQSKPQR